MTDLGRPAAMDDRGSRTAARAGPPSSREARVRPIGGGATVTRLRQPLMDTSRQCRYPCEGDASAAHTMTRARQLKTSL